MLDDLVVGVDLGTTNSAIAVFEDGEARLIPIDGRSLLPSVISVSPEGELLVGQAARNQLHLYPDRSVRSIKRKMGQDISIQLGERSYTPVELSAVILRRLKIAAEADLGRPVTRAVITVPAYFSDAQRTATREAGEIAGFKVERVLNEPTAAALCYTAPEDPPRTFLIYDLGGGTFDVSIVRSRGAVVEVLASHGDAALGGDDFDVLLGQKLRRAFEATLESGDLEGHLTALARLTRATEEAKIKLSSEAVVDVRLEHLIESDGIPCHLNVEVQRQEYEGLIESLLYKTQDSVQIALRESGLLARDIDDIILVGGSSRTPRVQAMLAERFGKTPRMDLNPEEVVAVGAALQAARIQGVETGRILVDITPFSFGTSHLGELHGRVSPHCHKAIVHRNTPLPARQSNLFYTVVPGQEMIKVEVFQGEDLDARNNVLIGNFEVTGHDPSAAENSPILFTFDLSLDGILDVSVIEKNTGLEKTLRITDAFRKLSVEEIERARSRIQKSLDHLTPDLPSAGLAPGRDDHDTDTDDLSKLSSAQRTLWAKAEALAEKAQRLSSSLSETDREEVEEILEGLSEALQSRDWPALDEVVDELADTIFYLE